MRPSSQPTASLSTRNKRSPSRLRKKESVQEWLLKGQLSGNFPGQLPPRGLRPPSRTKGRSLPGRHTVCGRRRLEFGDHFATLRPRANQWQCPLLHSQVARSSLQSQRRPRLDGQPSWLCCRVYSRLVQRAERPRGPPRSRRLGPCRIIAGGSRVAPCSREAA